MIKKTNTSADVAVAYYDHEYSKVRKQIVKVPKVQWVVLVPPFVVCSMVTPEVM